METEGFCQASSVALTESEHVCLGISHRLLSCVGLQAKCAVCRAPINCETFAWSSAMNRLPTRAGGVGNDGHLGILFREQIA